jgi:parallel beta-helix repeat protein
MVNRKGMLSQHKILGLFVILILAGIVVSFEGYGSAAYAIDCGDTIYPGEKVKLNGDLNCNTDPAIKIIGPATLDMKDHTIYGQEEIVGIKVEGEGAKVMNGTVTGCDQGVVIAGEGGHQILKVAAQENYGDGFLVRSDNNQFIDSTAESNEDAGFRVYGDGNRFVNNAAVNNNDEGFDINGDQNELTNNTADGNRSDAIEIDGNYNRLINNTASNDQDEGIVLDGNNNVVHNNTALSNSGDGIEIDGNNNTVTSSKSERNGKKGIHVFRRNKDNAVSKNTAINNSDYDMFDENIGCIDNTFSKNKFNTSNLSCIE